MVVLNPDSGRGYLSRVFDDQWMANFGFLRECDECIAAVLDARGDTPSLLYVNPSTSVRNTIDLMRANGIRTLANFADGKSGKFIGLWFGALRRGRAGSICRCRTTRATSGACAR